MILTLFLYLLAALLGLFLLLCLMTLVFQEQMIFHPQPLKAEYRERLQPHEIDFERPEAHLRGWYLPAADADAPLLVYYGGNGEEIAWNSEAMGRLGVSLLLINYRGYGDSSGKPGAGLLREDALRVLDEFTASAGIPPERVVLMGRSLGSGVATFVASQRTVAGVILVTPYDTLSNVARSHYPFLPMKWLMRHDFDSAALAPAIRRPLLNLIAGQDKVVPPHLGERLGDVWGGEETRVRLKDADHITITDASGYWEAIRAFIGRVTCRSPVPWANDAAP